MPEVTSPSEDARSTIFLIEEDVDAHRPVKRHLRGLGYRVLAVLDSEDALEWAISTNIPVDLMLFDLVGKSDEEALELGRTIRQRAKFDGNTPLVVLPDKFKPELEGEDVNVTGNDWICYYEDGEQLPRLLNRLLTS